MTAAQVRSTVDTWLSPRWTAIQTQEATYLAAHGRYFQGLLTHVVAVPADGLELAPDNVLVKPTDQAETWADLLTLPLTMPCALRLDVYNGPQGQGFVATVTVAILGTVWTRSAQIGAETARSIAWRLA